MRSRPWPAARPFAARPVALIGASLFSHQGMPLARHPQAHREKVPALTSRSGGVESLCKEDYRTVNSRKLFALVPIVIVLARSPLTFSLEAKEPAATVAAAPVQPLIVRAIELQWEGLSPAKKKKLLAGMRIQIGKPYSEQAIEEDIRHIFYEAGGNFGGRSFAEPVPGGVKVIFAVRVAK